MNGSSFFAPSKRLERILHLASDPEPRDLCPVAPLSERRYEQWPVAMAIAMP